MEEKKFNRNEYMRNYYIEHTLNFSISFRNEEDNDIIEKLKSVSNKTDYIRQLIRDDLSKK